MISIMEGMPDGFMKAFGVEKESFTTVEGFLAAKQYNATWPMMVILMLIAVAGSVIAGEIERGSIEIALARPVSRLRIYWGRYIAGSLILFLFTIFSVYSIIPLASIYNIDIHLSNVVKLSLTAFLFGMTVLSVSIFASAALSEKSRVYMIIGSLMVAMYTINTVALIRTDLANLKYASFFNYLDTNGALIMNEITSLSIIVFTSTSILLSIAGTLIFSRRDITI